MFAPRRLFAQQMSKYVSNVYSYRWDAPKYNTTTDIGVNHFSEVSAINGEKGGFANGCLDPICFWESRAGFYAVGK